MMTSSGVCAVRTRLDTHKLCDYVQQCLEDGIYEIDTSQGNCYTDVEYTAEDIRQKARFAQLQSFFHSNLIYDMGAEQIELGPEIMASFLGDQTFPVFIIIHMLLPHIHFYIGISDIVQPPAKPFLQIGRAVYQGFFPLIGQPAVHTAASTRRRR